MHNGTLKLRHLHRVLQSQLLLLNDRFVVEYYVLFLFLRTSIYGYTATVVLPQISTINYDSLDLHVILLVAFPLSILVVIVCHGTFIRELALRWFLSGLMFGVGFCQDCGDILAGHLTIPANGLDMYFHEVHYFI